MTDPPTLLELRRWHEKSQGAPFLLAAERAMAAMKPATLDALAALYRVKGATEEERRLALTFAFAALGGQLDRMGILLANLKPEHLAERVEHVDVMPQERG